ncbi:tetratricopeptide repeat protein [Aquimonas sp.]|jgi:Tfp pilus assembly protein PilF|uniref:tetratricopeptide repeat protein n=1 Tax=Aquimonas sp. TaxID=1872588 RepID=UPI0037C16B01
MANPRETDTLATKDGAEPKRMSMLGFVEEFKRIHDTMPNRRFAFILGAGASKSSGIKLAGEMAEEWVTTLHRQAVDVDGQSLSQWAMAENLGLRHYDHTDPAASYSELYRRMYGDDPDQGFAYLEAQMAGAEPSYGYSVLGRVLAELRHQVVITVNFDNLVADSVSLFSATYPLVCGHESLAHFARTDLRRPLVLKVHRDLLLSPMSDPDELGSVDPTLQNAITGLLSRYTPIVIGYGGNDDSLMGCLEKIPQGGIQGGIYWCYREGDRQPPQRIRELVAKHRGYLVPILGFDDLMSLLGKQLQMINPAELITERAKQRAERLNQQQESISKTWVERASKPVLAPAKQEPGGVGTPSIANTAPAEGGVDRRQAEAEIDAVASSVLHSMGKAETAKPWWRWEREAASEGDEDRRDKIYRAAIAALPNSPELLRNYAIFLTNVRKDHDAAETMYQGALETDPKRAFTLCSYADFLTHVRNDHDAAQTMYRRALEADPKDDYTLSRYADFLTVVRKDHDAAESMYQRALEVDPKYAYTLSRYADFLAVVRKAHDAAEAMYRRALEADPKDAYTLCNYANFLTDVRNDHDAAQTTYRRALEADPKDAYALGRYADFLTVVRKDHDAAESMYQRALEVDPRYAYTLSRYADFLAVVRKAHDAAETMYQRALEADPKDAYTLSRYADFLTVVRKDHDAAQTMYRRALEADPKDAYALGRYAHFLTNVRKDQDAAGTM